MYLHWKSPEDSTYSPRCCQHWGLLGSHQTTHSASLPELQASVCANLQTHPVSPFQRFLSYTVTAVTPSLSTNLLCNSAICHCDKIPKRNHLKGGKITTHHGESCCTHSLPPTAWITFLGKGINKYLWGCSRAMADGRRLVRDESY